MTSLKDGDVNIEGTENLLKHATDVYKELFGSKTGNLIPVAKDMWNEQEKLNVQDNEMVCKLLLLRKLDIHFFLWMLIELLVLTKFG